MELSFFNLDRNPFVGTPRISRLFWHRGQRNALQAIAYSIEGRKGVLTLVGARGMGKSMLLRTYLKQRVQNNLRTIDIPGSGCSFDRVLERLCQACDVQVIPGESDTTLRRLREALSREYAQGTRTILVLDEAEGIALPVLESILILADMKDESGSLLQIILLAEPALEAQLKAEPALRQRLGQLVVLQPFSAQESRSYVLHRIFVVALQDASIFTRSALRRIIRHAKGNPGGLNHLCSEAMRRAIDAQCKPINARIVRDVVDEFSQDEPVSWWRWGLASVAGMVLLGGLYMGSSALQAWWPRTSTPTGIEEPVQSAAVDPQLRGEVKPGFTKPENPQLEQSPPISVEPTSQDTGEPVPVDPAPAEAVPSLEVSPQMSKAMARAAGLSLRDTPLKADRVERQEMSLPVVTPGGAEPQAESETSPVDAVDPQPTTVEPQPEPVKAVVCLTPRPAGNRRRDIILVDAAGKVRRRLVSDGALNLAPILSPDGRTLAYTSYREGAPSIYLRNLTSDEEERLTLRPGFALPGSWAPNGRYLVLSKSEDGNSDIFLYDTQRRHLRRLTLHKGIDISPSFAPDSKRLVFTSNRTGSSQIYLTDVHGRPPVRLTLTGTYNTSAVWSPRGDTIAFIGRSEEQKLNIYTIRSDGTGLRQVTQGDTTIEEAPSWGPDGQSIMYTRVQDGRRERRIVRADGRDDRELPGHGPVCYSPQWVAQY